MDLPALFASERSYGYDLHEFALRAGVDVHDFNDRKTMQLLREYFSGNNDIWEMRWLRGAQMKQSLARAVEGKR